MATEEKNAVRKVVTPTCPFAFNGICMQEGDDPCIKVTFAPDAIVHVCLGLPG